MHLIVCNRPGAAVIRRAMCLGVDVKVLTRGDINNPDEMLGLMEEYGIDIVVLAGFLLMVPQFLIERYRGRL